MVFWNGVKKYTSRGRTVYQQNRVIPWYHTLHIKFVFSKKATKFDEILTGDLTLTIYITSNWRWRFCQILYSRVRNKRTTTFINFWIFFQGLWSYYRLKKLYILYKFEHFKGLRLFFLSNFPEATFIQGATSIPDSRVDRFRRNPIKKVPAWIYLRRSSIILLNI